MPLTKIRKRQIQLEGSDGLHSEYLRRTVDDVTDYALIVARGKPAGDWGFDVTGHRIVNVAEAVLDTDAPNWGQVRLILSHQQASVSVTGINLDSGSYDIELPVNGALLDPDNSRTSFNVYINGVRLTQDESVNAYEILTNASGQATAVRLNAAGIRHPILPDDRIDIVYWRA
jgi:hypothetical protein